MSDLRLPKRRLRLAAAFLLALPLGCSGSSTLTFASFAKASAFIREEYKYQVLMKHADGPLSYSLTTAPSGLVVSATGLVSWTPQYADLGSYPVVLEVRDTSHTRVQQWTLKVRQGLSLGVTLSPKGHTTSSTPQDFADHYAQHAAWGRILAFHTPWREDVASAGQVPSNALAAIAAAQQFGFTPAIGLGWTDGSGAPDLTSDGDAVDNSWTNAETRSEYLAAAVALAQNAHPPYLFLGNETNTYWLSHTQNEWDAWISEFEDCYDAIKSVSPNTMVFTVFQYEHMLGLGANAGWSDAPHLDLIDDHVASDKIDALGFTSYPFLEFADPTALPADYYDAISAHWSGPVVFTELGWLASPHVPYPGSEQDQADFVDRFFALTDDLDLEYVTWLFLHDWDGQASVPSVADIGLRSNDGSVVRAADARWKAAVQLRE